MTGSPVFGVFLQAPSNLHLSLYFHSSSTNQANKSRSKPKLSYGLRNHGQSVLVSDHRLRPTTNFSFSFLELIFRHLRSLIWDALPDERVWSVIYGCCWASSAQSVSGPSPEGLTNILYCLNFETPPSTEAYLSAPGWTEKRTPDYDPLRGDLLVQYSKNDSFQLFQIHYSVESFIPETPLPSFLGTTVPLFRHSAEHVAIYI
jgi:hypothetical protein